MQRGIVVVCVCLFFITLSAQFPGFLLNPPIFFPISSLLGSASPFCVFWLFKPLSLQADEFLGSSSEGFVIESFTTATGYY